MLHRRQLGVDGGRIIGAQRYPLNRTNHRGLDRGRALLWITTTSENNKHIDASLLERIRIEDRRLRRQEPLGGLQAAHHVHGAAGGRSWRSELGPAHGCSWRQCARELQLTIAQRGGCSLPHSEWARDVGQRGGRG